MKKITLSIISLLFFTMVKAQCNEPTNIHINNGYDTLFIGWDSNNESLWDVEYGENSFSPTGNPNLENIDSNGFNLDQIPNSIYYDIYVRANCGSETSDWIGPFTFYNYCLDFVGYDTQNETFDDEFIPDCWTQANQGSFETSIAGFNQSNWESGFFANTGTNKSAKINLQGTSENNWLVLPASIGLLAVRTNDGPIILNFEIALTQHNSTESANLGLDDKISLIISTDLGNSWSSIQNWDSNSTISNTGESIQIEFFENDDTQYFDLFENIYLISFLASNGIQDDANVDFFIDNLNFITAFSGASVNDLKSKGFTYYPNPIKNTLNLNANENINSISIYNYLGQEVKNVTIDSVQKEINLNNLEKGIYFMKVQIDNTKGFVSLIKE